MIMARQWTTAFVVLFGLLALASSSPLYEEYESFANEEEAAFQEEVARAFEEEDVRVYDESEAQLPTRPKKDKKSAYPSWYGQLAPAPVFYTPSEDELMSQLQETRVSLNFNLLISFL